MGPTALTGSLMARSRSTVSARSGPSASQLALEEERDFLLGSIDDLEAEHAAGDLNDHDYETLCDTYTARAADVLRRLSALGPGAALPPGAAPSNTEEAVVANAAKLTDMRASFKPGARGGEVRLVLPLADRGCEMEFVLPGRYDVSPQDAGKISAMAVVAEIVET